MKRFKQKLALFLSLIIILVFATSNSITAYANDNNVPGNPTLSHNAWGGEYDFTLEMNMWWGTNGTSWKIYENNKLIHEEELSTNSPNAQQATYNITGKAKGTYEYKCELINSYGKSVSNVIKITVTQSAPIVTVPSIPSNISAKAKSHDSIEITWDSVENATNYDLNIDGKIIENVSSPYIHDNLKSESKYSYKVRAKNSKGPSSWSNLIDCTTLKAEKPITPKNLSAKAISNSSISIKWDSVPNAKSYELLVDGKIQSVTSTNYTHANLKPKTTHTYKIRAINEIGSSIWSNEIACTTLDGTNPPLTGNLPDRVLVGYWHNFDNGSTTTRLKDISADWDVIQVAFAESLSDHATMTFTPYNVSPEEFKKEIEYLQSKGKKVLISIGGQNGTVELKTTAQKEAFVKSMSEIIDFYGFDGLDIDLEGGCVSLDPGDTDFKNPTTPKNINLISATKELCSKYGNKFLLTMAPEITYVQGGFEAFSGPWGAYLSVIHGLRDELDLLHVQHYNHGSQRGLDGNMYTQGTADFQVAMTEMMITGFNIGGNPNNFFPGLPAEKIAIGLPACPKAAGGGYTPPAEVKKALDYLINGKDFGGKYKLQNPEGYSKLRGVMTWSINWDEASAYEFSTNYRQYFDALPK